MNIRPLLLCFALAACGDHYHPHPAPPPSPRHVSILVEVYDPITNMVWENVSVRIVDAWNEWSGCTCTSPYVDWRFTDVSGRVFFDELDLALAEVGFLEDQHGALLNPYINQDEAVVLLEVDALGFSPVFVEVPLRWSQPDVFVEIPFN